MTGILRGLSSLLPQQIKNSLAMAPAALPPRGFAEKPAVFEAQGARRARVALLSGCAQPVVAPWINEAAIRFLTRHGVEVVIANGAGCCGALTHHLGQSQTSHSLAEANIAAWMREIEGRGLDAIVTTTSGCGTMLKDYGHVFREHPRLAAPAKRIASLARDITELVATLDLASSTYTAPSLRIAYQSPCSMNHGQKIHALPMKLLADAGFEVQPLPEAHVCCGSAGTYNLLQPQIAGQLRKRKQALIEAQRPDVVATGNVGCMMQLSQDSRIPIVHTIELLDWATGGPKPRFETTA